MESLRPCEFQQIAEILDTYLFEGKATEKQLSLYFEAVKDLPSWAITQAIKDFNSGSVEGLNPDFRPKPPALAKLVKSYLSEYYSAQTEIAKIQNAQIER